MNVSIDSSRRRPSSSISCIETSNRITEAGTWERLVISRGDWVLMQPNRRRKRKYSNIFLESWKGRVKDFQVAEGKKSIKEVLVQHVYMHRELVVEQYPPYLPKNRPNCKCLQNQYIMFTLLASLILVDISIDNRYLSVILRIMATR